MSRFKKLSQSIWHCQYHIVWVPKYRYKVLRGELARDVENLMRAFSQRLECEIIELNVQNRPCAYLGNDTTKTLNIILCRTDERKSGNKSIEQI